MPLEDTDDPVFASMSGRLIKKPFKAADIISSIKMLTSVPVEVSLNQPGVDRRAEKRQPWVGRCLMGLAGSPRRRDLDISFSGMIKIHGCFAH